MMVAPADGGVPSVESLVAEAARCLAADDAAAAVGALAAAAGRDAEYMPLHFVTTLVAWSLGDLAKSLALARDCHERDPMNGSVAEVVASLYAQIGDLVESLYFGKLATALKADPVLDSWLPQAFPSFDKAFLTIQDRPLLAQARTLLAQGKLREGLDKARQHVEVAPGDDDGRDCFAASLLRGGLSGVAVAALQPAAERGAMMPPSASLYARALAQIGDADAARRWHDEACAGAPDDSGIAAARIADACWLGGDGHEAAAWSAQWLARFARAGKPPRWRPAAQPLVIGYLVANFADRRDAGAVAAVARAHARPGVSAVGYGLGAQSWDENAPLRGAFDKWRDVTGVDPATLARILAGDGLHAVIDAGGFASPLCLEALARVDSAVRVAWLGSAAGLERTIYDAVITPRGDGVAIKAGVAEWNAGAGYPLLRDWTQSIERTREPACRFGADAYLCQIDAGTAGLWRAALEAAPTAVLLLRANDMAGDNIDRLVQRMGADVAARIDVIDAASAEDFYRLVDVALTPIRGASPRMAAEAVACGTPVLAFSDGGAWQPYAGMLRQWGLGDLVAATPESYAGAAASLAERGVRWETAAAAARAAADRGEAVAVDMAAAIEICARTMLGKAAA
jgi:tetratricopeptide (TPR) repeat protein